MEATDKLQEASYLLKKIKKMEDEAKVTASEDRFKKRRLALRANLSAFILAWQSIPEILLYDFAEALSLGISRNERTDRDYFVRLSKGLASRNGSFSEAVQSYEWLDQQQRRLFETHKLLADWRHVVAHRGIVVTVRKEHGRTTRLERVFEVDMPVNTTGVSGSFGPSGWVPSPVQAAGARAIMGTKSDSYVYGVTRPLILPREEMKKESYSYLRNDPERRPIVERCQNAYNDMNRLVEDAEKRIKSFSTEHH